MEPQSAIDPDTDRSTDPDIVNHQPHGDGLSSPADEILRRWKGKEPVRPASVSGPLTLMKLPVDILRLIFNEVASCSRRDLLELMATNSTLHNLVAPYIHSSFDIVWPDESDIFAADGLDALTHGLSTLTLGNRFAQTIHKLQGRRPLSHRGPLHNNYAQYTRSFCMGNGLPRWVSDYSVTTESGKMLNTLVALALQKMVNLESFKWDMPTGLSADVFMALASLQDLPDGHPCKLEQVWVRWHDSRSTGTSSSSSRVLVEDAVPPPPAPFPPPAQQSSPPSPTSGSESAASLHPAPIPSSPRRVPYSENQVEYPTFSVLPALRSITVLDIDQVAYLDELSLLVERSRPILKELRLSISPKVKDEDFTLTKGGDPHKQKQVDLEARWPGESNIGGRRLGGVLGVVLGRVYDLRKNWPDRYGRGRDPSAPPTKLPQFPVFAVLGSPPGASASHTQNETDDSNAPNDPQVAQASSSTGSFGSHPVGVPKFKQRDKVSPFKRRSDESDDEKLTVECLELERIPLHTLLCAHAFDWSILTSLTILHCRGQEKLWRALRERYEPTLVNTRPRRGASRKSSKETWQYHLKLKRLHIDVTTFALMNFLNETLAPNSLEVLYLHDRRRTIAPPVPIRQIFMGPIKRQHASLRKLLLDSTHPDRLNSIGDSRGDPRRMCWAPQSDMLMYITSGKMLNLRELSISLEAMTWHTFLQSLPNIPRLTCLCLPSVGNSRTSSATDTNELGLQVVDVIALRPEICLRYLGIRNKRFEIVESRDSSPPSEFESTGSDDGMSTSVSSGSHPPSSDVAVEDEDEIPPIDDESEPESHASRRATHHDGRLQLLASPEPAITYRLHEIFYEEKIDIFKARLGKL